MFEFLKQAVLLFSFNKINFLNIRTEQKNSFKKTCRAQNTPSGSTPNRESEHGCLCFCSVCSYVHGFFHFFFFFEMKAFMQKQAISVSLFFPFCLSVCLFILLKNRNLHRKPVCFWINRTELLVSRTPLLEELLVSRTACFKNSKKRRAHIWAPYGPILAVTC